VTKRAPTAQELADLKFAFRVAKHVKSNAIVTPETAPPSALRGTDVARRFLAHRGREGGGGGEGAGLSESLAKGSVVASDAFFPFPTACWRRGGGRDGGDSARRLDQRQGGDRGADQAGLAMVFTGVRHFRH